MNAHSAVTALLGSSQENGDNGISKGVAPQGYRNSPDLATADYAAGKVAARFRLRIETARVVCHLAGLAVARG